MVGSCTSLEFWVRFPNERNHQGKQAHPVLKYRVPHGSQVLSPAQRVGSRSPDGWDQIPYRPGGWVLHQPPWSFGFDSQTRGTRENRRTLC